jgi:excisionase family DNA binding protein
MKLAFTKREAAEKLGISLNTLNRYKNLGKIPHRKIGDRVLFTDGDLAAFLDSCAVPATSNLSEREKLETLKRVKGV